MLCRGSSWPLGKCRSIKPFGMCYALLEIDARCMACCENAKRENNRRFMGKPVPILVVDDERDHATFISDILANTEIPYLVHVVESGEEAIAYLCGDGRFSNRSTYPFPFLLLLDLRMPGIGGFGVMRWLCAHPELKQKLNLIVLSAVQSSKDIEVVYELGAQLFCPKTDSDTLQDQVRHWHAAWVGNN
jgi:CheY-like chemotaxis protein